MKISEEAMAASLVSWLTTMHWNVYQEVQISSYGPRADIVAVQGAVSWIIETKTSFKLAVLDQAVKWLGYANYVSVATPHSNRAFSPFLKQSLEHCGIGVLTIGIDVRERVAPRLWRSLKLNIREKCRAEHKTFAPAGNSYGARWTPFQATAKEVVSMVKRNPGISMKDLVDNIQTHYYSAKTARSALTKWLITGVIKGVKVEREGRALKLFPEV